MVRGEGDDGFAGDAGIRELDRSRDDRFKHLVAERVHHPIEHLARVQRARIEHGGDDAVHFQGRVQALAHLVKGVHQQAHAAQREVLTLERNEQAV